MNFRTRRVGLLACAGALMGVASCVHVEGDAPTSRDAAVESSPGVDAGPSPSPSPSFEPGTGVLTPLSPKPAHRLVSPGLSERPWARESEHAILWEDPPGRMTAQNPTSPDSAAARVSYSLDDGATWTSIPDFEEETGRVYVDQRARRARLTVPAAGGTAIRVRVTLGREHLDSPAIPLIPSQKRNYSFTQARPQLPMRPRDGACGLVHDGAMWVLGGWNPDDPVGFPAVTANDVWRSTDAVTWLLVKPNTFYDPDTFDESSGWSGRHTMGCVAHGGKMFIVGGDAVHKPTRDVWSSTDGVAWTRVSANTNYPARVLQPVFSFQDKLWVVSGQTFFNQFTLAYPDVWSSRDGSTWTRVPTEGPLWAPRGMMFGPAVFKGRMWLVAGGLYDEPARPKRVHYDDVWSSADGVKWERDLEHTPFIPRDMLNVDVFDDRLWILGGYSEDRVLAQDSNLSDVFYTADGSNWYELVTPPTFTGRHAATTWRYQGSLYWGLGNVGKADVPGASDSPDAAGEDAGPVAPANNWGSDLWKISVVP